MKTIEDIKNLLGLNNHHTNYDDIFRRVEVLTTKFDELATTLRTLEGQHDDLLKERDELLAQPTKTQYVLHGDIQPCTVLYSDETTTLLRLDEGDVMCETDTVEWHDEVTYRCQELLREAGVRSLAHVAPKLADLVRNERITLNDEPVFIAPFASELDTDKPCEECEHPFDKESVLCPMCLTVRHNADLEG